MTQVHWQKNNNFIHYGGARLDMLQVLGYSADRDESYTGQTSMGFCFDDHAGEASATTLMEQLPRLIFANEAGLSFAELFATTCNATPADSNKYKEARARLVAQKEIEIVSPDGSHHFKSSMIGDKDQIIPSRPMFFGF